jgi:hypothetical protein
MIVSLVVGDGERLRLTQGYVMVRVQRNVLLDLDVVYAFEQRQAVSYTHDAHLFEVVGLHLDKSQTGDGLVNKGVGILRQTRPQSSDPVGDLLSRPFGDEAGRTGVERVRQRVAEGGGRVLSTGRHVVVAEMVVVQVVTRQNGRVVCRVQVFLFGV